MKPANLLFTNKMIMKALYVDDLNGDSNSVRNDLLSTIYVILPKYLYLYLYLPKLNGKQM